MSRTIIENRKYDFWGTKNQPMKIRLEEIEKLFKWLKMMSKSNFRTLKLKSHEEYLTYRTNFIKLKT